MDCMFSCRCAIYWVPAMLVLEVCIPSIKADKTLPGWNEPFIQERLLLKSKECDDVSKQQPRKNSTKIILRLARQAWLQTKDVPCNPFAFTKVGLRFLPNFANFAWWFRLVYEMHVTTLCWSINSHNCALGGMVTLTCCTSYINKLVHSLNTTSDMDFVKNFTHPDFQAKSFTPQKCVICDSFFAN